MDLINFSVACASVHRVEDISVFLGLGSNLGPREQILEEAVAALDAIPGCHVARTSAIYETSPWGREDQPFFLNQVVVLKTRLLPADLFARLKTLERRFGRERERVQRWGARTLDIDLLLYGDEVVREEGLTVPHPHLAARRFVLEPLAEVAANLRLPLYEATVAELLAQCPDQGIVRRITRMGTPNG